MWAAAPLPGGHTVGAVDRPTPGERLARAIREAMDDDRPERPRMTAAHVAQRLSVSKRTVERWTTGEAVPDALTILPLARLLAVDPMLLLDPPDPPVYPIALYRVPPVEPPGVTQPPTPLRTIEEPTLDEAASDASVLARRDWETGEASARPAAPPPPAAPRRPPGRRPRSRSRGAQGR